ncbi:hypothetical protein SCOCK_470020 [Actinacidiphila cocklensis]|uniref:Uncharacterized protein n=1 Tax=Actinacidiphila cocklensis TaxID=887465 RepID=A0A9W4DUZ2_9ACTN|nr:hypothetical protein SCOCK_470020 [Actinacidiphila cocklensis]
MGRRVTIITPAGFHLVRFYSEITLSEDPHSQSARPATAEKGHSPGRAL